MRPPEPLVPANAEDVRSFYATIPVPEQSTLLQILKAEQHRISITDIRIPMTCNDARMYFKERLPEFSYIVKPDSESEFISFYNNEMSCTVFLQDEQKECVVLQFFIQRVVL
jgi:hypothetical protein